MTSPPLDLLGRPLGSLRLSVTDRCNLRCRYCMPEADYAWLPRDSLLTFEEMATVARAFVGLGVRKLRLTGGEPLLRRDLDLLVAELAASGPRLDLALTTNGVLLRDHAAALRRAGLGRVTISLDTLRADRMRRLAGRDELGRVLDGIAAAGEAGLARKLNTVVIRGANDDELLDLLAFGAEQGIEVRFIEYMDVGGATGWSGAQVVGRAEILDRVAAVRGTIEPLAPADASAPAERFRLADGQVFGIVASTTAPFCRTCDRGRLTADGMWFACLYAATGLDLRGPLRAGAGPAALARLVADAWGLRDDRGAERRAEAPSRTPLYTLAGLRADPHREMHTRGG